MAAQGKALPEHAGRRLVVNLANAGRPWIREDPDGCRADRLAGMGIPRDALAGSGADILRRSIYLL